jgi:hypothetical protein
VNGKNEEKEAKTEKRRGKGGGESGASKNRAIRKGNWNGKAKRRKSKRSKAAFLQNCVNGGFRGKAPAANAKRADPELKLTDIERQ